MIRAPGSIKVSTGLLQETLEVVVPKRRRNARRKKSWPIELRYDAENCILEVAEAFHA